MRVLVFWKPKTEWYLKMVGSIISFERNLLVSATERPFSESPSANDRSEKKLSQVKFLPVLKKGVHNLVAMFLPVNCWIWYAL